MNFIFNKSTQINNYNNPSDNQVLILNNKNKSYGLSSIVPDDLVIKQYFSNTKYECHIAFYDSFPGYKNAEYELLKRFKRICEKNNIGVFIIYSNNIIQNGELRGININDIDSSNILCVISLHFNSPKTTKHYTLMTIWNPIKFHSGESWENTCSVDGFLSAYSDNIDNFVTSISSKPIVGYLNPSISEPIFDFTFGQRSEASQLLSSKVALLPVGDRRSQPCSPYGAAEENFGKYKCFYAGMNWHMSTDPYRVNVYNLIKELDKTDIINIYGLKNNWTGYACYKEEIPFDGYSIVQKIHDCGVCIVLSSQPHIDDSVCSCRLFEGLAAGVPIIADKNPFFITWFGDNLFYIDTEDTDAAVSQIKTYIEYIEENPEEVLVKMENCRKIFLEHFILDKQFLDIINKIRETNGFP